MCLCDDGTRRDGECSWNIICEAPTIEILNNGLIITFFITFGWHVTELQYKERDHELPDGKTRTRFPTKEVKKRK